MTFRDDHDATLARAEALEQELARSRVELTVAEEECARLAAELATLTAEPDLLHPSRSQATRLTTMIVGGTVLVCVPCFIIIWLQTEMGCT